MRGNEFSMGARNVFTGSRSNEACAAAARESPGWKSARGGWGAEPKRNVEPREASVLDNALKINLLPSPSI